MCNAVNLPQTWILLGQMFAAYGKRSHLCGIKVYTDTCAEPMILMWSPPNMTRYMFIAMISSYSLLVTCTGFFFNKICM